MKSLARDGDSEGGRASGTASLSRRCRALA